MPPAAGSRLSRLLPLALALLAAAPARAQTCDWIQSVSSWSGSLGWSFQHRASWSEEGIDYRSSTSDAGSASFVLEGLGPGDPFPEGVLQGSLGFFDRLDRIDPSDPKPDYSRTELSGEIVGPGGVPASMTLQLDEFGCTYTWQAIVYANGTVTSPGSVLPTNASPNLIFAGTHEIPPNQAVLTGSELPSARATFPISQDPAFLTYAAGAAASATALGEGQLGTANVSWMFVPGASTTPLNDRCEGARFFEGSTTADTTSATSAAGDPSPSCGGGDRSVWFTFVAPGSGAIPVATAGSGYETTVSVWRGDEPCDELVTQVACGGGSASVAAEAGAIYRVMVQRRAPGGTGALQLTVPEPAAGTASSAAAAALAAVTAGRRARRTSGGIEGR